MPDDAHAVPFREILSTLVDLHAPGVRAAIFCDDEGEKVGAFAVDGVDPYEVDLLGAACAPIAQALPPNAAVRVILADRAVWLARVDAGYFLAVLAERCRDGSVRLDLLRAVAALAAHM